MPQQPELINNPSKNSYCSVNILSLISTATAKCSVSWRICLGYTVMCSQSSPILHLYGGISFVIIAWQTSWSSMFQNNVYEKFLVICPSKCGITVRIGIIVGAGLQVHLQAMVVCANGDVLHPVARSDEAAQWKLFKACTGQTLHDYHHGMLQGRFNDSQNGVIYLRAEILHSTTTFQNLCWFLSVSCEVTSSVNNICSNPDHVSCVSVYPERC